MHRRALRRLAIVSGCLLGHSLDLGRARRHLRPLAVKKPRLSGHLQGADLLGKGPDGGAEDPKDSKDANKGEKKAGPDGGGVQETKEGPEEA